MLLLLKSSFQVACFLTQRCYFIAFEIDGPNQMHLLAIRSTNRRNINPELGRPVLHRLPCLELEFRKVAANQLADQVRLLPENSIGLLIRRSFWRGSGGKSSERFSSSRPDFLSGSDLWVCKYSLRWIL